MDVYKKFYFSNRGCTSVSVTYGSFMEADRMFYQRETLNKYPKAKTIQDMSLTTLQENYKLIAGGYQKNTTIRKFKKKKKNLSKRKLKQPMLEVNGKDTQVEVQDDTKDVSEENS